MARHPQGRAEREESGAATPPGSLPEQYISFVSAPMQALGAGLTRAAPTHLPVLICGETGSGKSCLAAQIHEQSLERNGTLVAIECALVAAETVAALSTVTEGSALLEEIGDLSPAAQNSLVRVMDDRSNVPRFIATTTRDLNELVSRRVLRADLLYRLDVVRFDIPPLRERPDDIAVLAECFLALIGRWLGRDECTLTADAQARLLDYHWPGNIRELRSCLLEAALRCDRPYLSAADLHLRLAVATTDPEAEFNRVLSSLHASDPAGFHAHTERLVLQWALASTQQNRVRAATVLGISRGSLRAKLRRHDLDSPQR